MILSKIVLASGNSADFVEAITPTVTPKVTPTISGFIPTISGTVSASSSSTVVVGPTPTDFILPGTNVTVGGNLWFWALLVGCTIGIIVILIYAFLKKKK